MFQLSYMLGLIRQSEAPVRRLPFGVEMRSATVQAAMVESPGTAAEILRRKAALCRDLAETAVTPEAKHILGQLASDYETRAQAEELENSTRRRPAFRWHVG
jgi:hypothetical protein